MEDAKRDLFQWYPIRDNIFRKTYDVYSDLI